MLPGHAVAHPIATAAARIWRSWSRFWFEPISPVSIGLFRLLYGALVLLFIALIAPNSADFFARGGILSGGTAAGLWGTEPHLSVLFWLTAPPAVAAFFAVFTVAAVCLMLGLWSRASAAIVFICLVSVGHRNPLVLNGADVVLRITGFYLVLAPCGAALSVDRLRALARGAVAGKPALTPPWAQRLIQLQVSLIYAATVLLKLKGEAWPGGTALYYTSRLEEFRRFPVPFVFHSMTAVNVLTYWTLAAETAMAVLVWVPALRPFALVNGLLLHGSIEYSMNVPQFSFVMMATYVTFVDVEALWERALGWLPLRLRTVAALALDPACERCARAGRLVAALDVLRRVELVAATAGCEGRGLLLPDGRLLTGSAAFRWLAWRLPLLWPVAPCARLLARRRFCRRLALGRGHVANVRGATEPGGAAPPSLHLENPPDLST